MMRYEIAGLVIDFRTDIIKTLPEFEPYASTMSGKPDAEIHFKGCSQIVYPQGKPLADDFITWYADPVDSDGFSVCIHSQVDPHEPLCTFTTDKNWSHIETTYLKDIPGLESTIVRFVGSIVFRNLSILHEGVLLHASSIKWQDKGIVFTAPSGTGKSTQAGLWESYMGATIINDDVPALKLTNNQVTVHGTPWCGSEYKHMNSSAPVAAIFVLEQSKENRIRRLTQQEIALYLLPRFLLPFHDKRLMDIAIQHVAKIMGSLPIYLLQCRPDQEAVELARLKLL